MKSGIRFNAKGHAKQLLEDFIENDNRNLAAYEEAFEQVGWRVNTETGIVYVPGPYCEFEFNTNDPEVILWLKVELLGKVKTL